MDRLGPQHVSIVLLHSLLVLPDGEVERGKTYWFSDGETAYKYLVEGDPCEHRWTHVVVVTSVQGPSYSDEVMSWWSAVYEDGILVGFSETPSPLPPGSYVVADGATVDILRGDR